MDLTKEQIEMLRYFENGAYYRFFKGTDAKDDIVRFLDSNDLIEARADVGGDDWYAVTQRGKSVLEKLEKEQREASEKKTNNKIQALIAALGIVVALLAAAIGFVSDHFDEFRAWFSALFKSVP